MRLAKVAELNASSVSLAKSSDEDVLLIERFDHTKTDDGWTRRAMDLAVTLFCFEVIDSDKQYSDKQYTLY